MTKPETPQPPAVGSLLERGVRPVARVQRMGSFQGVPHYGCLLNLEAEHRMKVNDPLYGQAELDAAVAAADREWFGKLEAADTRVAALTAALREVLEFQSAREGPTIHDWGRWRRVADDTPSHGPNVELSR